MADKQAVYKCEACGSIIEVLTAGDSELACCGKPMNRLTPNTVEASREKHVPVLEVSSAGDLVKVGAAPHPMEEKHYIEWIAVKTTDGKTGRKFLEPGDKPEALFEVRASKIVELSAYCNTHGLWSSRAG
ncbi:MAG: desulfoferrodoxin [Candidatus Margulisbacteria bacterium]|jgi:superoxide reductase|nr:desulfoferrodoxin [Candidatus Margulisiibacteriota bacterium]